MDPAFFKYLPKTVRKQAEKTPLKKDQGPTINSRVGSIIWLYAFGSGIDSSPFGGVPLSFSLRPVSHNQKP